MASRPGRASGRALLLNPGGTRSDIKVPGLPRALVTLLTSFIHFLPFLAEGIEEDDHAGAAGGTPP